MITTRAPDGANNYWWSSNHSGNIENIIISESQSPARIKRNMVSNLYQHLRKKSESHCFLSKNYLTLCTHVIDMGVNNDWFFDLRSLAVCVNYNVMLS